MKLFITTLVKFGLTFVLLVFSQLLFFKTLLSNNVNYNISENKTILIIGDSQPETALNDSLIDKSINLSNAGDPLFFNYIKLKKILKNNNQFKTVILGFSTSNLGAKEFYVPNKLRKKYATYFYLIDFEDYKDIIKYNIEGLIRGVSGLGRDILNFKKIIKEDKINKIGIGGYRPLPISISKLSDLDAKNKAAKSSIVPDQLTIDYFLKIVDLCKKNNVKLIVLNTPVHKTLIEKRITQKNNYDLFLVENETDIIIWDYENFKLENKYFFDSNHLNYNGAKIFSKFINTQLTEKYD